jgi:hypothetical protein
MVNDWMANDIRGKLIDSLESKEFIPFSTFVHDSSLNDLFFSDISAEWDIFKSQFDNLNPNNKLKLRSSQLKSWWT